ncbi:hypothetical protein MXZ32_09795 [Streptococcus uberis]|nr:hypothetical protein [Streptococcus uberis]MCK1197323.1 hypothetical protein [Streptococcus uberis]
MKKIYLIFVCSILSLMLFGCTDKSDSIKNNDSSDSKISKSNKKEIPLAKYLSKGKHIFFYSELNSQEINVTKDTYVNNVFVFDNGKVTTYEISDTKLSDIKDFKDKELIKFAEKADLKKKQDSFFKGYLGNLKYATDENEYSFGPEDQPFLDKVKPMIKEFEKVDKNSFSKSGKEKYELSLYTDGTGNYTKNENIKITFSDITFNFNNKKFNTKKLDDIFDKETTQKIYANSETTPENLLYRSLILSMKPSSYRISTVYQKNYQVFTANEDSNGAFYVSDDSTRLVLDAPNTKEKVKVDPKE